MPRYPKPPDSGPPSPSPSPYPRDNETRRSLRSTTRNRERLRDVEESPSVRTSDRPRSELEASIQYSQLVPPPSPLRQGPNGRPATPPHHNRIVSSRLTPPPSIRHRRDKDPAAASSSQSRTPSLQLTPPRDSRTTTFSSSDYHIASSRLTPPPSQSLQRADGHSIDSTRTSPRSITRTPHPTSPELSSASPSSLTAGSTAVLPPSKRTADSSRRASSVAPNTHSASGTIAIERVINVLDARCRCFLCGGFVGKSPYTIACGHTFCGPCLAQEFRDQLAASLRTLRSLTHRDHQPHECQAVPRTKEERDRLAVCVRHHNFEVEWIFQYRCPRLDCRTMVSTRPRVDQKLQEIFNALLGALSGRFYPEVYTSDLAGPKHQFCGLFLGDHEGESKDKTD
ncbi:hypothetical protein FA13DRAFT_1794019 [Coprinellus micaceus]|uniref:RING-type domain-containing protein n=1 Tax=Coprinellus micaceus TaxID=71717 RepID=A0A4Y7T3Q1_COPMI|nr:hypothetical protein FA13DRAFT_1794019 [Coprinellus micaceus]